MFYVISQPFLKISTLNFVHIFISYCPLTNYPVFETFDFEGENFEKEKKLSKILKILRNFQNFQKPR